MSQHLGPFLPLWLRGCLEGHPINSTKASSPTNLLKPDHQENGGAEETTPVLAQDCGPVGDQIISESNCYIWCIIAPKVLPKIPYELSIAKCQELTVPRLE